jgi:type IV secretory pathway component VirB8
LDEQRNVMSIWYISSLEIYSIALYFNTQRSEVLARLLQALHSSAYVYVATKTFLVIIVILLCFKKSKYYLSLNKDTKLQKTTSLRQGR